MLCVWVLNVLTLSNISISNKFLFLTRIIYTKIQCEWHEILDKVRRELSRRLFNIKYDQ